MYFVFWLSNINWQWYDSFVGSDWLHAPYWGWEATGSPCFRINQLHQCGSRILCIVKRPGASIGHKTHCTRSGSVHINRVLYWRWWQLHDVPSMGHRLWPPQPSPRSRCACRYLQDSWISPRRPCSVFVVLYSASQKRLLLSRFKTTRTKPTRVNGRNTKNRKHVTELKATLETDADLSDWSCCTGLTA